MFPYFIPTKLLFGQGAIAKLHKETLPGKKALIVISSGKSTRSNGYLDKVAEQLRLGGAESVVFDQVMPNPVVGNVMDGARMARTEGCDFVVGLGGGSSIDASKAIAMMATNPGDYWDYVYGGSGGGKARAQRPLPLIAIPTTAGTGTEMDPWMVITNEYTIEKIGGGDESLFPVIAVVDPELMRSVPPRFTAYQGFDALFHSVECYLNKRANLMSDMLSLEAVRAISQNLASACRDGKKLPAREQVAFGSTLGGMVMCVTGTTSAHAMEHALSAFHQDLPHGAGLIMLSASYHSYVIGNFPITHERYVRLAQAMGKANASDPMDFVHALSQLEAGCGVADLKMSDYGITPGEIPAFVKNARETMGILFRADRFSLSDEDCASIYQNAFC